MKARRATLWALFGTLGLLWGGRAEAQEQPWITDRRFADGRGVRAGDYTLHFGIGAEFGYDSNLLLRSGSQNEPRVDALVFTVAPYLRFNNALPAGEGGGTATPTYLLTGTVAASYNEFIKTSNAPADTTPTAGDIAQHRNVGALAGLDLKIAPTGRGGADVHANYIRTIQPSQIGDPSATYDRDLVNGGGAVIWRPGGGLFNWQVVGYDLFYTAFENQPFAYIDNFSHQFYSRGQWRFRPRTALVFDTTLGLIRYTHAQTSGLANGDTVTTRAGLNGLLTNAIGFTVLGGWGSTYFNSVGGAPASNFDSFVGQAELRFYLSSPPKQASSELPTGDSAAPPATPGIYPTLLTVGYTRGYSQSYLTSFYAQDRGYASLAYFFNGSVLGTLSGGIAHLAFPDSYFDNGAPRNAAFSGTSYDATVFVEYRPTTNLGINLRGVYTRFETDELFRLTPAAPAGNAATSDDLKWERYQIILGVRYLMLRGAPSGRRGRRSR